MKASSSINSKCLKWMNNHAHRKANKFYKNKKCNELPPQSTERKIS